MPLFLLWLISACGSIPVEKDLRVAYCRAALAWFPYRADVSEVRWCQLGECEGDGGGRFDFKTRTILIDPDFPFPVRDGAYLTLTHELGHGLGLKHRTGNSIMRQGWDPPIATGPTVEDFQALRKPH